MKKLSFIILLLIAGSTLNAQVYITSGKITYERRINMWADLNESHFEGFKKMIPQYKVDQFTLTFNEQKSLYAPHGEMQKIMMPIPASDNVVYTDFNSRMQTSSKNVFEKSFIIEEALRNATWKIKDDFRDIAGFNCRRATTLLFDSVFVVAFYTDEIIPSAGPESFHGLPGAILGLVINRLHTTWYATKVEVDQIDEKKIIPPQRGTKTSMADLRNHLSGMIKNFGAMGNRLIWMVEI